MRRWLVRGAVVTTVAVVTLAAAHSSIKTTSARTSPKSLHAAALLQKELTCLDTVFRHAVPEGARIYVGVVDTTLLQLLSLIVTRWASLTLQMNAAQWSASLQPGFGCQGLRLSVVRLR